MAVGIIAEYNPFHNGHIYHLNKVKEMFEDEEIILVLSGNFTQRGLLSVIEKYDKAEIALNYGVDLVIELPFHFATQSSDYFAKGSLKLLNSLGCTHIVFGSESNNIEELNLLADTQINNKDYERYVKEELNKGINYPTAMSNALEKITGKTIRLSNDLLAISYIKEIKKNKYNIKPITIKRTNSYSSEKLEEDISSASSIRKAFENNIDISNNVPKDSLKRIINTNNNRYLELLKYKILSSKNLSIYQTVDEGIENKLIKEIDNCKNLNELIQRVKSKRYTYNKIYRMLTHILCSFTKEENTKYQDVFYIKVLGFSKKGQEYLNSIKKEIDIPLITNIKKDNIDILKLELRVDNIYNLITNRKDDLLKKKPIIKDIN